MNLCVKHLREMSNKSTTPEARVVDKAITFPNRYSPLYKSVLCIAVAEFSRSLFVQTRKLLSLRQKLGLYLHIFL